MGATGLALRAALRPRCRPEGARSASQLATPTQSLLDGPRAFSCALAFATSATRRSPRRRQSPACVCAARAARASGRSWRAHVSHDGLWGEREKRSKAARALSRSPRVASLAFSNANGTASNARTAPSCRGCSRAVTPRARSWCGGRIDSVRAWSLAHFVEPAAHCTRRSGILMARWSPVSVTASATRAVQLVADRALPRVPRGRWHPEGRARFPFARRVEIAPGRYTSSSHSQDARMRRWPLCGRNPFEPGGSHASFGGQGAVLPRALASRCARTHARAHRARGAIRCACNARTRRRCSASLCCQG